MHPDKARAAAATVNETLTTRDTGTGLDPHKETGPICAGYG